MSPSNSTVTASFHTGFWRENVALVQLLGLCPLLAVTTSVVNGLALGLATLAVLVATSTVVALTRGALLPAVRVPLFVLLLAALVTCVDLLTNALFDDLHRSLGLFIPLIVTNCALHAQAEAVAAERRVGSALLGALAKGLGFLAVLVALGALRELLGSGTLLAGLEMLAGERAAGFELHLPVHGMLVAVLPPGAFFGMALLLALRNLLARARTEPAPEPSAAGARYRAEVEL